MTGGRQSERVWQVKEVRFERELQSLGAEHLKAHIVFSWAEGTVRWKEEGCEWVCWCAEVKSGTAERCCGLRMLISICYDISQRSCWWACMLWLMEAVLVIIRSPGREKTWEESSIGRETLTFTQGGLVSVRRTLVLSLFDLIKFTGEPGFDFLEANTESSGTKSGGTFGAQAELHVISITLETDIKSMEDMAKRK